MRFLPFFVLCVVVSHAELRIVPVAPSTDGLEAVTVEHASADGSGDDVDTAAALRRLLAPGEATGGVVDTVKLSDEELAALWDKRQAELKAAMENVKSDGDRMAALLTRLLDDAASDPERVAVLDDLEFLCTSSDNAVDFAVMGGLAAVVPLLNATSQDVAAHANTLLGTTVKMEPEIVEAALSLGALSMVVASLDVGLESPSKLTTRALYALGSLIRYSPEAQDAFSALHDAPAVLGRLLASKVQIKALALVGDLSAPLAAAKQPRDPSYDGPKITFAEEAAPRTPTPGMITVLSTSTVCDGVLDAAVAAMDSGPEADAIEKAVFALADTQPLCEPSDRRRLVVSQLQILVMGQVMSEFGDPARVLARLEEAL